MKKFLLFAAAAMVAASASAAEAILAETDFANASSYNFWKSDVTNAEIKDGGLTITNETATENFWDIQYMVADNFTLVGGTEYTVDVKIKGFSGTLHYNLGTWGSNVNGQVDVEKSSDWQNVVFKATAKEDTDGTAHLLLQSGDFVGAYTVANVKITYNEENGETPVEPVENVIATYFDGNGGAFGGWGGTIEQVEEDGKPCLKYSNAEAKDFWATQIAIDLEYVIGETYYFSFDVKGTGEEEITSGFQYAGKNNAGDQVYWGCGDCTGFKASAEWKNVVISGTAQAAEEGQAPGRWVANLGQYVGDLYITNVKVYTMDSNIVETIAPAKVVVKGVYNLQGVKVADTLEEVAAPGLYIYNGKKVVR